MTLTNEGVKVENIQPSAQSPQTQELLKKKKDKQLQMQNIPEICQNAKLKPKALEAVFP